MTTTEITQGVKSLLSSSTASLGEAHVTLTQETEAFRVRAAAIAGTVPEDTTNKDECLSVLVPLMTLCAESLDYLVPRKEQLTDNWQNAHALALHCDIAAATYAMCALLKKFVLDTECVKLLDTALGADLHQKAVSGVMTGVNLKGEVKNVLAAVAMRSIFDKT